MQEVMKNYINYMIAWQQEHFPTLPTKNPFQVVSHLLYCNGNGSLWMEGEKGIKYLSMQVEFDLTDLTTKKWVTFPFLDTLAYLRDDTDKYIESYKTLWNPELENSVFKKAEKVYPALSSMDLNSQQYWEDQVLANFLESLADLQKYSYSWKRYQENPEMASLGFPYDFQREVSFAFERYIPVLNLLNISKKENILHNNGIFQLTATINEAVIKVYGQIIDSPTYQEILGPKLTAHLRNRLNHFMSFHAKHFLHWSLNHV